MFFGCCWELYGWIFMEACRRKTSNANPWADTRRNDIRESRIFFPTAAVRVFNRIYHIRRMGAEVWFFAELRNSQVETWIASFYPCTRQSMWIGLKSKVNQETPCSSAKWATFPWNATLLPATQPSLVIWIWVIAAPNIWRTCCLPSWYNMATREAIVESEEGSISLAMGLIYCGKARKLRSRTCVSN